MLAMRRLLTAPARFRERGLLLPCVYEAAASAGSGNACGGHGAAGPSPGQPGEGPEAAPGAGGLDGGATEGRTHRRGPGRPQVVAGEVAPERCLEVRRLHLEQ